MKLLLAAALLILSVVFLATFALNYVLYVLNDMHLLRSYEDSGSERCWIEAKRAECAYRTRRNWLLIAATFCLFFAGSIWAAIL